MRYDLFLAELRKAPCQELRSDDEEYFELVVKVSDLPKVNQVLETFFGKPVKPAGAKPSSDDKKMANEYGGIRDDQTLYYLASEELYYYSFIWPWANGQSVTVKVFRAN
jgi:hypothetical protein